MRLFLRQEYLQWHCGLFFIRDTIQSQIGKINSLISLPSSSKRIFHIKCFMPKIIGTIPFFSLQSLNFFFQSPFWKCRKCRTTTIHHYFFPSSPHIQTGDCISDWEGDASKLVVAFQRERDFQGQRDLPYLKKSLWDPALPSYFFYFSLAPVSTQHTHTRFRKSILTHSYRTQPSLSQSHWVVSLSWLTLNRVRANQTK